MNLIFKYIKLKKILFLDILRTRRLSVFLKELKNIRAYTRYYKIKPDDVVIDIGAYHGWFSLLNYSKIKKGKLYCLEIDPVNFSILKKNIVNNNLNIKIYNIGVWENTGTANLYGYRLGSMGSRINYVNRRVSKNVECNVITLEDFIKQENIKKIDFIKIDVEGAEIEILKSSIDVLKKYKPTLSIATYHIRNSVKTYLEVEKLLKKANYPKVFTENKKHLVTYAMK